MKCNNNDRNNSQEVIINKDITRQQKNPECFFVMLCKVLVGPTGSKLIYSLSTTVWGHSWSVFV